MKVAEHYKDEFWTVVRKDYCIEDNLFKTRNFGVRNRNFSNAVVVSVVEAVADPNLDKDFKWSCEVFNEDTLILRIEDFLTRNMKYVVLWTDGYGIRSYVTSSVDVNSPDIIQLTGDMVRFMKKFNGEVFELCRGTGEMVHVGWNWMKKYKDIKEVDRHIV